MRYKIFIFSLIMIACMCFVTAYADERIDVQVDKSTCVINVSGNLGIEFSNKRVILYCVEADDDSELSAEENVQYGTQMFKIFRQTNTNENGAYVFENLKINSSVGNDYVFYLTIENETEPIVSDVMYITTVAEINGFLETMSGGDADEIYNALETELEQNRIGINVPLYAMLNDEGRENVAAMIAGDTYSSVSAVEAFVNPNSIENCLYNIRDVEDIDKILFADSYPELDDYKTAIKEKNGFADYKAENPKTVEVLEKMTAAKRTGVYGRVYRQELTDADEFYNRLSISVINYELDNVSGYGDVSGILKKYSSTTLKAMDYKAYSSCKYKNEINKDVLDEEFESTEDLCDFVDSLVAEYNDKKQSSLGNSGSGSGGGGRGSGGYGGSAGFGVAAPPATETLAPEAEKKPVFKDLENHQWAKPAIEGLYKKGAVSGAGNDEFKPQREVTREEFVKMLVLALDYKLESGNSEFDDVAADAWFAPYIFTATKNGLVNGVADGKFGVGMPITREDAAVLIWRVAGGSKGAEGGFADGAEVSDYAKDAVNWLKGTKIVSGYEDGTYRPKGLISRAETAKILWTFCENR